MNSGGRDPDKKFCSLCKKKVPSVETVLILDENITRYRIEHKDLTCDDCNRERQKNYRDKLKGIFQPYVRAKYEEELRDFESQWNDPEFKHKMELSDKVVAVWNKYHRRSPPEGLQTKLICSVIFADDWYVEADKVIEDLLDKLGYSKSVRLIHKDILLLYIPLVIDAFRQHYRNKAETKWAGLVDAINKKYVGREKIVARPQYKDEKTKEHQDRWFLLTREPDLKIRTAVNEIKKVQIDVNIGRETDIVERQQAREQEILQKEREKQERQRQHDNKKQDEESNEGGE